VIFSLRIKDRTSEPYFFGARSKPFVLDAYGSEHVEDRVFSISAADLDHETPNIGAV